jgi:hypothetical protein
VTTTTIANTVAEDEAVQAIHAVLVELSETQERLRARHHALSTILSRRFNSLVSVPREVADVSVPDASREIDEINRQLAALERRIDAQHGALVVADFEAQGKILESVMPAYRQLADEAARQAFLADLRRRGVFQTPLVAERKA